MGAGNAGEGDWDAPGQKYVKILAALRGGYEIECSDSTCKNANLYLSLGGMRLNKFMKYTKGSGHYKKLTWEANADATVLERREWEHLEARFAL